VEMGVGMYGAFLQRKKEGIQMDDGFFCCGCRICEKMSLECAARNLSDVNSVPERCDELVVDASSTNIGVVRFATLDVAMISSCCRSTNKQG
ncbi:MAG: hypothetical protein Q7T57_04315, partial [Dehalococcoidales bacterium]|nr:hypothetical protein [Dehalococcoidales bacterium]